MIKKMTIRLELEDEQHRTAYEILMARNRHKYRAFADYIVPAVIDFNEREEKNNRMKFTENEKQQIIAEILQELNARQKEKQEPAV